MNKSWLLVPACVLLASQVHAEPQFARMYKDRYGYAPSCNACHTNGGGSELNPFGQAFKKNGEKPQAFDVIAKLDSDGDGFANDDEAKAKASPGSKASTPKNPGDWLSTENVIPKEVQKVFPGVSTYKPLDAILTAKEIADAKTMGVAVSAKDENTIYVPVKDNKAIGTAIIVPADYKGQLFFLLVATDPKLGITAVQPVNTKHVPEAAKSPVYASFNGMNATKVPAPKEAGSVDGAITNSVKKAGVILYLRLKQG